MIVGTSDLTNVLVALIGMAGIVAVASIPAWISAHRSKTTNDRLGMPNGGGTVVGEITLLRDEVKLNGIIAKGALDTAADTAAETRLIGERLDRHIRDHPR